MGNLLSSLLAMSVAGSVVVGLMLLLRPVTTKIFSSRWQYQIGKMAIVFFLIPVPLFAGKLSLFQPLIQKYYSEPHTIQEALQSNGFVNSMDILMGKHLFAEVMEGIVFIWLVGATVFALWHFYCYRRFTKELWADSIPVPENTEAAALLSSCKMALGIHNEIKLMQNYKIISPMLVGLRCPIILLPASNMQDIDLKLVFIHELTHLQRKDLWVKMLALAAVTLHWFNPFAYVLRKDVSVWGELSCDEALASDMSHEERKLYGETILNTLDIPSGIKTAFCSSLSGSGKHIERRLTMLLNVKKMKKHIAIFAVAAILAIGSIGATVSALTVENAPKTDQENNITEMQAGLAINQTAISYDDYKIWVKNQKAVIQELVRTGEWSQESANTEIERYERILNRVENGAQVSVIAQYSPDGIGEERITVIPPSDVKVFLTDDVLIISD
ncbi:MAG TPA: peptidase M56 [Pelotomaculum sp.]|nr:peptidase M56 [Pelotomaculum sp.]